MVEKIKLLVLIIFLSNTCLAKCPKPVQYLQDLEMAPCAGFLFSPEKEMEVRIKLDNYSFLEDYSDTQEEVNEILTTRLQEAQKYNENLEKRLRQEKRNSDIYNFLYFGLGVIVTGLIAGNVGR